VLANLRYGIEGAKGLVVVTGEVGTGKTTILRAMLQSLDRSVLAAYLFNPILSSPEFFNLLAGELRLKIPSSKADLLRAVGQLLLARSRQGLRTVLVVDEAHLLPPHLMEEIRLLSNFETNREKLLQIVLCGQPELHQLLNQPELRQLKQRISLKCAVKPLTENETAQYIRWRLRLARGSDPNLFMPDAIAHIHTCSGGIPRVINNICDNALLTGFGEGTSIITAGIVRRVTEELDLPPSISAGELPAANRFINVESSRVAEPNHRHPGNDEPDAPPNAQVKAEPLDNVRYIRPEVAPRAVVAPASPSRGRKPEAENPQNESAYFVIEGEEAQSNSESRFFSRVRVAKRQ
jgi:general secretion pathway protein A